MNSKHRVTSALPKIAILSFALFGLYANSAQATAITGDVVKNTQIESTLLHRTDSIQKLESDSLKIKKLTWRKLKKIISPIELPLR